jgi:Ca2+-binding EF-hand superfamily protein
LNVKHFSICFHPPQRFWVSSHLSSWKQNEVQTRQRAQQIKAAFEFLDIEKTGQVSLSDLKKRLGIFFPEMTSKEFRFLMNNRKEITLEDLNEFLSDSSSTVDGEFDPIAEAFKVNSWTISLYLG